MEGFITREKSKRDFGLINKTWQRCKSLGRGLKSANITSSSSSSQERVQLGMRKKSKSCPRMVGDDDRRKGLRVAPEGCFTVYVGAERRRFVVRTEYANHPLFKMLLDEAESEFGYDTGGPLMLPCHVDIFYRVLLEMDDSGAHAKIHPGCAFAKRSASSYHLLSPSPMLAINQF